MTSCRTAKLSLTKFPKSCFGCLNTCHTDLTSQPTHSFIKWVGCPFSRDVIRQKWIRRKSVFTFKRAGLSAKVSENRDSYAQTYPFVFLLRAASAEAVLLLLWRHVVHPASRRPPAHCPAVLGWCRSERNPINKLRLPEIRTISPQAKNLFAIRSREGKTTRRKFNIKKRNKEGKNVGRKTSSGFVYLFAINE